MKKHKELLELVLAALAVGTYDAKQEQVVLAESNTRAAPQEPIVPGTTTMVAKTAADAAVVVTEYDPLNVGRKIRFLIWPGVVFHLYSTEKYAMA